MRKAQEELAKQKEVIMAQDKELKVNSITVVVTRAIVFLIACSIENGVLLNVSGEEYRGK